MNNSRKNGQFQVFLGELLSEMNLNCIVDSYILLTFPSRSAVNILRKRN